MFWLQELSSGAELTANKSYYKTLAAHLTGITLSGATSGKLNHWHLVVTNSGGAYTTSFNTTIKWSGEGLCQSLLLQTIKLMNFQ